MTRTDIDPAEMPRNYYLLEDNEKYKILILYILKKLNNDVKQTIFNILVTEEESLLELDEIRQLINQNWYEFDLDIELSDLSDIESEWYHSD